MPGGGSGGPAIQIDRTKFEPASQRERELQDLEISLARQLGEGDLINQLLGQFGEASGSLSEQLRAIQSGEFFNLPEAQEAALQGVAGRQLGGLLGNLQSRGIASSSLAGGAAAGLASGLTGLRADLGIRLAQQRFGNTLTLANTALRNRLILQDAITSPLNRLQSERFAQGQRISVGQSGSQGGGGSGQAIGSLAGLGLGATIGTLVAPGPGTLAGAQIGAQAGGLAGGISQEGLTSQNVSGISGLLSQLQASGVGSAQ